MPYRLLQYHEVKLHTTKKSRAERRPQHGCAREAAGWRCSASCRRGRAEGDFVVCCRLKRRLKRRQPPEYAGRVVYVSLHPMQAALHVIFSQSHCFLHCLFSALPFSYLFFAMHSPVHWKAMR